MRNAARFWEKVRLSCFLVGAKVRFDGLGGWLAGFYRGLEGGRTDSMAPSLQVPVADCGATCEEAVNAVVCTPHLYLGIQA